MQWKLGPFILTSSSLSFSVAVLVALLLIYLEAQRKFLSRQRTVDFMLLVLISGLVGARLIHALCMDRIFFLENPARLLHFHLGGFSFFGGLFTALIAVLVWSGGKKFAVECYLDCAAPALAVALIIGWTGYPLQGKPMAAPNPWGIQSGTEVLHPDGVYVIIMLMLILTIIWRRRLRAGYDGELFFWFVTWYALTIMTVDRFRVVAPFWKGFTLEQLIAIAALSLSVLYILFAPKNYISPYHNFTPSLKPRSRGRRLFEALILLAAMGGVTMLYYYLHGWPVYLAVL